MKKKLAMLFKILATGTFSLFLAACYGMMMQWKKITALYIGSGVKDLKVTMFEGGFEHSNKTTDTFGVAQFTLEMTGAPLNVTIEAQISDDPSSLFNVLFPATLFCNGSSSQAAASRGSFRHSS